MKEEGQRGGTERGGREERERSVREKDGIFLETDNLWAHCQLIEGNVDPW